jgi:hypothetical protein
VGAAFLARQPHRAPSQIEGCTMKHMKRPPPLVEITQFPPWRQQLIAQVHSVDYDDRLTIEEKYDRVMLAFRQVLEPNIGREE